jgi:hypothetical protein
MLPCKYARALTAPLVAGHQDDGRSSIADNSFRKAHASPPAPAVRVQITEQAE